MGNAQVLYDIKRFKQYLEANGVRILALSISFEANGPAQCYADGASEMLEEQSLTVLADLAGFTMKVKE